MSGLQLVGVLLRIQHPDVLSVRLGGRTEFGSQLDLSGVVHIPGRDADGLSSDRDAVLETGNADIAERNIECVSDARDQVGRREIAFLDGEVEELTLTARLVKRDFLDLKIVRGLPDVPAAAGISGEVRNRVGGVRGQSITPFKGQAAPIWLRPCEASPCILRNLSRSQNETQL